MCLQKITFKKCLHTEFNVLKQKRIVKRLRFCLAVFFFIVCFIYWTKSGNWIEVQNWRVQCTVHRCLFFPEGFLLISFGIFAFFFCKQRKNVLRLGHMLVCVIRKQGSCNSGFFILDFLLCVSWRWAFQPFMPPADIAFGTWSSFPTQFSYCTLLAGQLQDRLRGEIRGFDSDKVWSVKSIDCQK